MADEFEIALINLVVNELQNDDSTRVKEFLDSSKKIDINYQDQDKWTVLMHAVQKDFPKIVRLFILYGAKIELAAADGSTALTIARQRDNQRIIQDLTVQQSIIFPALQKFRNDQQRKSAGSQRTIRTGLFGTKSDAVEHIAEVSEHTLAPR